MLLFIIFLFDKKKILLLQLTKTETIKIIEKFIVEILNKLIKISKAQQNY